MNQQINLYQPTLYGDRPRFSAGTVATALVALVVGLLLLTLMLDLGVRRQESQLAAMQQQRDALTAQVAQLQGQFPPRQEDARLAADVARAERELSAKRTFLAEFDPDTMAGRNGFAPVLRGLARNPVNGLWLRELHIWGDGRLAFHGSALDPRMVPQFVERLGNETVFHGRDFRALRMQRPEQGRERVDFLLSTAGVEG